MSTDIRKTESCAKKLGEPGPQGMRVCGAPVEYVTARQADGEPVARGPYSGYRHVDRSMDFDHWPVPKSWLS